jgi:hypothetical protein
MFKINPKSIEEATHVHIFFFFNLFFLFFFLFIVSGSVVRGLGSGLGWGSTSYHKIIDISWIDRLGEQLTPEVIDSVSWNKKRYRMRWWAFAFVKHWLPILRREGSRQRMCSIIKRDLTQRGSYLNKVLDGHLWHINLKYFIQSKSKPQLFK